MLSDLLDRNAMWSESMDQLFGQPCSGQRRGGSRPGRSLCSSQRRQRDPSLRHEHALGVGICGMSVHGLIYGLKDGLLRNLECAVARGPSIAGEER